MLYQSLKPQRCLWCLSSQSYIDYHDREWGVPVYDNQLLFEMLILEGMQAGLSWITILNKRDGLRDAFLGFDPHKIITMSDSKVDQLMQNKQIIRHRLKIQSVINNAHAYLTLNKETKFSDYLWSFVEANTHHNGYMLHSEIPTHNAASEAMSRDLKKRGFKFVGEKICYAFMQATGMVNDHLTTCFRYQELKKQ